MISLLVTGKLINEPACRTSAKGVQYIRASISAPVDGEENVFCSVIAFSNTVIEQLSAMNKGDTVSIAGTGFPRIWDSNDREPQATLSIKADSVLTAYQLRKKRKATASDADDGKPYKRPYARATTAMLEAGKVAGLVDDLPWEQS